MEKKNNWNEVINKIFTVTLMLSAMLSLYGTGISTITFFDISLMTIVVLIVLDRFKQGEEVFKSIYINLIPMFIYIISMFLILLILDKFIASNVDVLFRTLRYLFYLSVLIFFVKDHFNLAYAKKTLKIIVLISIFYYFAQIFILKYFGVYIKGYIPFLNVMRDDLIRFSENAWYSKDFRARSIYGEISQYSIYLSIYLIILLFDDRSKKDWMMIIITTVGLILSISSLGVFSSILIWCAWFLSQVIRERIKINKKIIIQITVLLFSIVGFLLITNVLTKFTHRLMYSLSGRFSGYLNLDEVYDKIDGLHIIFGIGMDLSLFEAWKPSYIKFLVYFGLFGTMIYVVSIFYAMKSMKFFSVPWVMLIYSIILGFTTEVLIGNLILFIYPFIVMEEDKIDVINIDQPK